MAGWTGPHFPNSTTDTYCFDTVTATPSKLPTPCAPECYCIAKCGDRGCLFNIEDDPTEHRDVSEERPEVLDALLSRLREFNDTAYLYNPDRGVRQPGACKKAMNEYGGFWGPWIP